MAAAAMKKIQQQRPGTFPKFTGTKGETWSMNLDAISVGRMHLLLGMLKQNCGTSTSLAVLVRRALEVYFEYVQMEVETQEDWELELDALIEASGRQKGPVREKIEKAKARKRPSTREVVQEAEEEEVLGNE